MSKKLFIVESPAKAKTIEKYLGEDYIVASSYGHICDLPKNNKAIDVDNNFEPKYEVSKEKEKVVKELQKLSKKASDVYLATDEDREGEAISWHLASVLGLDVATSKRVTYTEITKSAIEKAIANPRTINMDLVHAQQARRILDRLVGFEISPILWRKVKPSLSAGRVQSVAVRLIVEREREIQAFQSSSYYKLQAFFDEKDIEGKKVLVRAESADNIDEEKDAKTAVESFVGAKYIVSDIVKKDGVKRPAAPFTTSTLQQEASKKLGFSVARTMQVAQRLYESGFITYMRTDSVHLSDQATQEAKNSIVKQFGDSYHKQRTYASKSKNAQEAHEAIRPTDFNRTSINENKDQDRLYKLIWQRAIASQMSDAKIENTNVTISNDKNNVDLIAKQEIVVFDGFLKVYVSSSSDSDEEDENKETLLPPVKVGQEMNLNYLTATEKFKNHPPRYNEASLVKKLEELGIGRPSTYAPTISTIQRREYVLKDTTDGVPTPYNVIKLKNDKVDVDTLMMNRGVEKSKLFPTDIGILVTDFLKKYFDNIVDYKFTANIEEEFDNISNGELKWQKMLGDFYKPFHEEVENTLEIAEHVSGERILGEDPETGEVVLTRMGRFGPMVQIGVTKEDEPDFKPRYARLRKGQSIETISLEEAMDLFKLPRTLGEYEGLPVKANIGRFGPYIVLGTNYFVSLKKEDDVQTIDLDTAIERILEKRDADAKKMIKDFGPEEDIKVLNGRWGPFIKQGKNNFKIPKTDVAEELTLDRVREIIESQNGGAKSTTKTTKATKTTKKTKKTTKKTAKK